jgi:4-amino-4-deoxy-L-arabinose transferase-like glycosyltransferase
VLRRRSVLSSTAREWLTLAVILLAALALYSHQLDRQGWANAYYAAAAQAGATDWRVTLFGGLDRGGVLSTDKPPLALWVMTASVRLFGLSPASLIWPQLLMTLATVAALQRTVRRCWGPAAGLVAAAVLASTPVVTVLARYDHPDTLLVLLVTGAAYLTLKAGGSDDVRRLAPLGAVLGAAFLTKWLVVLLVLPGLVGGYLATRSRRPRRSRQRWRPPLVVASTALAVAGWWPVLVWLTPSSARPWLDGTKTDSVWDLMLGRNGFSRIGTETAGSLIGTSARVPWNPVSGAPGPGRLLMAPFAAQTSWFLPLALTVVAAAAITGVRDRPRRLAQVDPGLALFGGWLLTTTLVFSLMSGPIHPYYVVLLAPAAAALVGRLVVVLVDSRAALAAGAALAGGGRWLGWAGRRGGQILLACLVLITPAALGSLATVTHAVTGPNPLAGPGDGKAPHVSEQLTAFLRRHHGHQKWGAAMAPASSSSMLALDTELAVLPVGGFVGNVPTPSLRTFQQMVQRDEIRYLVLTDPYTGSRDPHTPAEIRGSTAASIVAWAESVGHPVHLEGETTSVIDLAPPTPATQDEGRQVGGRAGVQRLGRLLPEADQQDDIRREMQKGI